MSTVGVDFSCACTAGGGVWLAGGPFGCPADTILNSGLGLAPLAGFHGDGAARVPDRDRHGRLQPQVPAQLRSHRRRLQRAARPLDVHLEPAPGAQAGDLARWPGRGQRRQQVHGAAVALQQHLGHAGGVAEVAVDLERRVGVEQVGVKAAAAHHHLRRPHGREQVADDRVGVVAVAHARPEVDLPAHRPAGGLVAAQLQRARPPRATARAWLRGDLVARVEAVQVRQVAVLRLALGEVLVPLLQLPAGPDLVRRQLGQLGRQLLAERRRRARGSPPPRWCARTARG